MHVYVLKLKLHWQSAKALLPFILTLLLLIFFLVEYEGASFTKLTSSSPFILLLAVPQLFIHIEYTLNDFCKKLVYEPTTETYEVFTKKHSFKFMKRDITQVVLTRNIYYRSHSARHKPPWANYEFTTISLKSGKTLIFTSLMLTDENYPFMIHKVNYRFFQSLPADPKAYVQKVTQHSEGDSQIQM